MTLLNDSILTCRDTVWKDVNDHHGHNPLIYQVLHVEGAKPSLSLQGAATQEPPELLVSALVLLVPVNRHLILLEHQQALTEGGDEVWIRLVSLQLLGECVGRVGGVGLVQQLLHGFLLLLFLLRIHLPLLQFLLPRLSPGQVWLLNA